MSQNKAFALVLILIAFVATATRMLAFSQPYHQDEYDFAIDANPKYELEDFIPHPYLAPRTYEYVGGVVGYDHLRAIPIALSLATLVLLFFYMRKRWGNLAAAFSVALYTVSAYALIGSVQVDIDGGFLPLFTLLAFMAYGRLLGAKGKRQQVHALLLLGAACFFGFSSKLSFVLVPAALLTHFACTRMKSVRVLMKDARILVGAGVVAGIAILSLVFGSSFGFLRYIDNFTAFGGRDYMQVVFQTVKAMLYVSPVALAFLLVFKHRRELFPWLVFLVFNILFYYVVFDFTHRTFDRYLLFIMLPLAVTVGVALGRAFGSVAVETGRRAAFVGVASALLAVGIAEFVASLPHRVIPLIPKSAFVESVAHLKLDILLPMTGGSGPLGFYVPVDALILLWGASFIALAVAFFANERMRAYALAAFLGICFAHASLVMTEYLTGTRYGSAPSITKELLEEIRVRDTGPILTYNDIGAYDLMEMGKYAARFYPHTEFIPANLEKLRAHEGSFLVVGLPLIAPDSVYGRFFSACEVLAERTDKQVTGQLLDCRSAKDVLAAP